MYFSDPSSQNPEFYSWIHQRSGNAGKVPILCQHWLPPYSLTSPHVTVPSASHTAATPFPCSSHTFSTVHLAVCFCFSIWNALPLDLCICFISAQISPSPRGLFWPAPSKLATCPCHPPFLMVVITLKSLCSSKCSCVYPPFPSLKNELWGAGTSRICLGSYPQHLKQCLAQRTGLIHVC